MKLPLLAASLVIVPAAAVAEPTRYPLTIENCGTEIRIEKPPQRAVGIGQNSTEIMLMLGLADRMVGSSGWISPVLPELAADNAKVPRITNNTPTFEAVVSREPDFVAVQFASAIGPQGRVGTRRQFSDLGIASYASPIDCAAATPSNGNRKRDQLLPIGLLFREIDEISRIFDVADRGQALIARFKAREEAVRQRVGDRARDVSLVFWFSSSEVVGDAWVAGRYGASAYIAKVLGARNVIESDEDWPLVGWETIAAADPTVLVIGTMERRTQPADDPAIKMRFLKTDPVVGKMSAVEKGRIVPMDAQAMNPTLRTILGLEIVADALERFGLLK